MNKYRLFTVKLTFETHIATYVVAAYDEHTAFTELTAEVDITGYIHCDIMDTQRSSYVLQERVPIYDWTGDKDE